MCAPGVLPRHGAGRSGAHPADPRGHREDALVPCAPEVEAMPAAPARPRRRRTAGRTDMIKDKFDELLPFYVNHTLDAADREWVDAYLREHPKSAAELQWYRTLQDTMQRDAPAVSAE